MKRFLSLLLCISLLLSVNIGTIQVGASAEDKTMIEPPFVSVADTTNTQEYGSTSGTFTGTQALMLDGVKNHWFFISNNGDAKKQRFELTNDTSFGNSVLKATNKYGGYFEFFFGGTIAYSKYEQKILENQKGVMEGKYRTSQSVIPSWTLSPTGGITSANSGLGQALKANTWYDYKWEVETGKTFKVSFKEVLSAESSAEGATPHEVSKSWSYTSGTFKYVRFYPSVEVEQSVYLDDMKLSYQDAPYEKAEIVTAGDDDVVQAEQNKLYLELSQNIPNLTKDHIKLENTESGDIITADAIVVSDGAKHTVDVSLSSNLASWSEYKVTIDPLAFGEGAKQRTGSGEAEPVSPITKFFDTTKPSFATKGFSFEKEGNKLVATGLVVNTSGTPKDMKFIFSSFASDGRPYDVAVKNYNGFDDATGNYLTAEANIGGAEKFNFFVMDNWTNKNSLLGVSHYVDSIGENASQTATGCGTLSTPGAALVVNELNHTTKTLNVNIDTRENEVIDGILLVYKDGEVLSDGNLPQYIRSLSTAADGTLAIEIPLSESLDYGEYTAEFASSKLAESLTYNFTHYTPEELLAARKTEILNAAKEASNEEDLKIAILGLNASDEKVNSNFDIFGTDADTTNYESAYDRDNIFTRMLTSVSSLDSYEALVSLFEEASAEQIQYEAENPTIMIESGVITVADTTHTTNYGATKGTWTGTQALVTDGVKNHWFYLTNNGTEKKECYEISNDTSFGYSVARFKGTYPNYFEMFFGGNIPASSDMTHNILSGQKGSIEGKIRYENEHTPSFRFSPEGGNAGEKSIGSSLKADTWYNFKWDVVTGSHIKVTFTEAGSDNPHVVSKKWNYTSSTFKYFRLYPGVAAGESVYLDDLKVYYELIPYEKAKIVSVGTDGVVAGGQNTISFELSNEIPELTKDHITVKNSETNEQAVVDSITVTNDATIKVDVSLASNLVNWSEYTITIDALAFGEGNVQRVGRQEPVAVTDIEASFTTTKPPFGAKPFIFTNAGDILNAKAMVANTTGVPKNMNFVFASFDTDGRIKAISPTEHTGFVNSDGAYLEANASTEGANKFNFFVIDNWTERNHLFGANYNVDASGNYLAGEVLSSCEVLSGSEATMELGDLDYENKKIAFKLDTKEGKLTDGILFVYKNGEVLSSSNLPNYAAGISTTADGTLEKEILLPQSLPYGSYTVEFSSVSLGGKVTKTFRYYSPDEILNNKRNAILADAKVASSAEGLSEVLMSVNSSGEKVNDNFEIFGKDADLTVYNKNTNKLNVFARMISSVSSLGSYDALVNLFEESAKAQRADEVAAQKLQIVSDAKAAVNAAGLMKVVLGIDDNEKVINTNFEVISSNANLTVYNSLKNKAAVFTHMFVSSPYISSYSELIALFENAANTQKSKENVPSKPSSNNISYGGSSTSMKETTSNVAPSGNQQVVASSSSVFTDMTGHWATAYVEALYKRGIMKGYEDGSFRGENSITRAELAKTLVETFEIAAANGNTFGDVASSSWYAQYVASAAASGIVNGFEDGSFGPDKEVTRQDAVLMLYRAMSVGRRLPIGYTFFTDDLDIADYASGAIRTLGDLGIVGGNSKKQFLPLNSITRAEVATIICRAIDYIESH